MPWYYVIILWIFYSFNFGPSVVILKNYVIKKSFKISTAYDIWFSTYRPSNLMITADCALVLVFINFLWAVYDKTHLSNVAELTSIHNVYTLQQRTCCALDYTSLYIFYNCLIYLQVFTSNTTLLIPHLCSI